MIEYKTFESEKELVDFVNANEAKVIAVSGVVLYYGMPGKKGRPKKLPAEDQPVSLDDMPVM